MIYSRLHKAVALALIQSFCVSGCTALEPKVQSLETRVQKEIKQEHAKAEEPIPVIASTNAAWLAGTPVDIAEPVLPILKQNVGYHPTKPFSLSDVSSWITQTTGLIVDTAEIQQSSLSGNTTSTTTQAGAAAAAPATSTQNTNNIALMSFSKEIGKNYYEGTLAGLLDVISNKSNSWWKIASGRAVFYRTETKTFYLPVLSRKFTGSNSITSSSGNSTNSGATAGSTTTGSTASGSSNSTSDYTVDFWADIQSTATTIAAGGKIATNPSAGSVTVTGTPAQVRHVEEWARDYGNQLSQQVAIEVKIYSVKLSHEENYNWNPNIIYKAASGVVGYAVSGPQAPAVVSGGTPLKLGLSLLNNATSGSKTQYSGTQLALQALSTQGHVVEQISQRVVARNGSPTPMQLANDQGYQVSSSETLTPNVGSTKSTVTGTLTTGFTALFTPRIVNGKVVLDMAMSNSLFNGFTTSATGDQKPNVDVQKFQQSVSLTPGDALMLTGLQRDRGNASKSGVGASDNYLLGGGVDNNLDKQLVAIVITATIL